MHKGITELGANSLYDLLYVRWFIKGFNLFVLKGIIFFVCFFWRGNSNVDGVISFHCIVVGSLKIIYVKRKRTGKKFI